jgi:hypothetical protein
MGEPLKRPFHNNLEKCTVVNRNIQGVLGGGNIIGGVLEGGRWDVRFEFVETRDAGSVWYTHPTYTSGFAFQQFVLGHPIGGQPRGFLGARPIT